MDDHVADDLALALHIADTADRVAASKYLSADLTIETKPDASPVTEADKATETAIRTILGGQRPNDGILGEEYGQEGDGSRRWIVDPIDGTANYMRGVPIWATLIALECDGAPTIGVVSAPALRRRWWARKGSGAWTRDPDGRERQLTTSTVSELSDASLSASDEPGWGYRGATAAWQQLRQVCWRVRDYGDFLPHMLVAEGAVDITAEPALMAWDMAALIPIVEEAGGRLTGWSGGDALSEQSALTTNGSLHEEVLTLLTQGP
ncbi:MAG: histidinol-phosphatase [Micrococcales bacterium]|nr:histidinol-phosphatase [Micrococcales bacterium]